MITRAHQSRWLIGPARWSAWSLGWLVQLAAVILVGAWLVGRVVSDRYEWSQWLLWIPTPGLLLVVLVGVLAAWRPALRPGRWGRAVKGRCLRWLAAAALLGGWFALVEHPMLRLARPPAPDDALHIIHWNGYNDPREKDVRLFDPIIQRAPDIVILTDSWMLPWREAGRQWLGEDGVIVYTHPFAVVSRVPVLECRSIVATEKIDVVLMRFDTTEALDRALTVYVVNLPSDLSIPRFELAARARELLDSLEIPPPDLMVGDFNITRDSAAMGAIAGDLEHAYHRAGRGYAASFPRELPLYHIDHVLGAPGTNIARYELFDPGVSRHCAQSVWIAR